MKRPVNGKHGSCGTKAKKRSSLMKPVEKTVAIIVHSGKTKKGWVAGHTKRKWNEKPK